MVGYLKGEFLTGIAPVWLLLAGVACRVGLSPTGKRSLFTARARNRSFTEIEARYCVSQRYRHDDESLWNYAACRARISGQRSIAQ